MNTSTGVFLIAEKCEIISTSILQAVILDSLEKLQSDQLNTEHLVRYPGSEVKDNEMYLLREYCATGNSIAVMQRYSKIDEPTVQSVIRDVIIGLKCLPEQEITLVYLTSYSVCFEADGNVKLIDCLLCYL